MPCIFCKIIKKEIPAAVAFEDDAVVVFQDIHPSAPVHFLSVPKVHIESVAHMEAKDEAVVFKMIMAARRMAEENNLTGYKLVFNVGRDGGQIIPHLHLHLLGGWKNGEERRLP